MKEGGRNKYGYYLKVLKVGLINLIFWLIFKAEFKFTSFEANGCRMKKIQKKMAESEGRNI